jgi:hypothetical protein
MTMKHQRIDNRAEAAALTAAQAQSRAAPYALSPDERTAVREALTRAGRGEFAIVAEVDATLRRPWG